MGQNLRHLRSRLLKAAGLIPFLPRALQLVWQAAPRWSAAWLLLLVIQGLLPAATVTLTRSLVDSLVGLMGAGGGWSSLQPVLPWALTLGFLLLLSQLLRGLTTWVRTAQGELVRDYLSQRVHAQSLAVDLAFYDLPDYFDHLHRARSDAVSRPIALLESLGGLLQNSITLLAMLLVLSAYGLWLPLILLASTLPALGVVLHYTLRQYQFRLRTTADERRTWYYDWLLTARETAAELRLFALGPHFQAAYQSLRRRLRGERLALVRSQAGAELVAGLAGLLATAAAMAWMIWRAWQGQMTLGDLALVYAAFSQGQGLLRTLLENFGQIYGNSLFLEDLFEFLALQPQVAEPANPQPVPPAAAVIQVSAAGEAPRLPTTPEGPTAAGYTIRFDNVTFRYPDSARSILQDFNLEIPGGSVAAIVGSNGAGKSTLVKLLCRFYDPVRGQIMVNGHDLRHFSLAEWRQQVTVLFQTPVQYNASLAENIGLGNLALTDRATIERAALGAGADQVAARLPEGYDSLLGIWFRGGTDLSVGEWQRLALARAYLRQAPLLILDEPTSAMDPWAEADWLARFRRLAAGRTALVITHRFTTARYADAIHVLDQGRILESGSHEALLAQAGRYAQSWQAQMRHRGAPPPAD